MSDNRINSNTSPMHQYWKDRSNSDGKIQKAKATEVVATIIQPQIKPQTTFSDDSKKEQVRKPLPPIPQSFGNIKSRSKSVSNVNNHQPQKIVMSDLGVGIEYDIEPKQVKNSSSAEKLSTSKGNAIPQPYDTDKKDAFLPNIGVGIEYDIEPKQVKNSSSAEKLSTSKGAAISQPSAYDKNKKGSFPQILKKSFIKREVSEPVVKKEEVQNTHPLTEAMNTAVPSADPKVEVEKKLNKSFEECHNNLDVLTTFLICIKNPNENTNSAFGNATALSEFNAGFSILLKKLRSSLQTSFNGVQDGEYKSLVVKKNQLIKEILGKIIESITVIERLIQVFENENSELFIYENGVKKEIEKKEILTIFKKFAKDFGLMFKNRLNHIEKDLNSDEKDILQAFGDLERYFNSLKNLSLDYTNSLCKAGFVDPIVNICQKKNSEPYLIKTKNYKNEETERSASSLLSMLCDEPRKYISLFEDLAKCSEDLAKIQQKEPYALFHETTVVEKANEMACRLKLPIAESDFNKSILQMNKLVKEMSGKIIEFATIVEKLIQVLVQENVIIFDADKERQNGEDKTEILAALIIVFEKQKVIKEVLLNFEEDLYTNDNKTSQTFAVLKDYFQLLPDLTKTYVRNFGKILKLNICQRGNFEPIYVEFINRHKESIRRFATDLFVAIPREISQYKSLLDDICKCTSTIESTNQILENFSAGLKVHEQFEKLSILLKDLQLQINDARNSIWADVATPLKTRI